MSEKIGVVLVNYHSLRLTLACLESLDKVKNDMEIVVVAVEASREEEAALKKHPLNVRVVTAKNLGFSASNNLGIQELLKLKCSTIVLLNNDTLVEKNFLTALVERLKDPQIGMVSPLIYFAKGREFHSDSYSETERGKVIWYAGGVLDSKNALAWHWGVNEVDHEQFNLFAQTDFATGCCLATKAEVIEKIGLLDENYFLYMEDVDWSVRVKKADYLVGFEPASKIWHVNAGSTGGSGSKTQQYYQAKSRLLFANKHSSWRTRLAVWREGLQSNNLTLRQATRDVILGKYGKWEE